jgi:hypothetical protein
MIFVQDRGGRTMRCNWTSGFLFALALAVQAVAPAAANAAMARGAFALALQSCSKEQGTARTAAPDHSDALVDRCAACALCCAGVAPVDARPDPIASAPLHWTRAVWTALSSSAPALRHDHARQARAPPIFS